MPTVYKELLGLCIGVMNRPFFCRNLFIYGGMRTLHIILAHVAQIMHLWVHVVTIMHMSMKGVGVKGESVDWEVLMALVNDEGRGEEGNVEWEVLMALESFSLGDKDLSGTYL